MRIIISKISDNQTISFATQELCRLLKEMDSTIVLSVLIAAYRFMYELGCRYLYPGPDGEKIPKKKPYIFCN